LHTESLPHNFGYPKLSELTVPVVKRDGLGVPSPGFIVSTLLHRIR